MLKSFYINGFRGLKDLKLELKPNLNVLVGPNGSGKSSILGGLELLSYIVQGELTQIRHKFGINKPDELFHVDAIDKEIHIKVQGTNKTDCRNILCNRNQSEPDNNDSVDDGITPSTIAKNFTEKQLDGFVSLQTNYEYECKINFDTQTQLPLFFSFQSVCMDFSFKIKEETYRNYFEYKYDRGILIKGKNDIEAIGKYIVPNVTFIDKDFDQQSDKFISESFVKYLKNFLYPVNNIVEDLSFGKAYDINPNSIKNDNKQHIKLNLEYDGSGLADLLMDLKTVNLEKYKEVVFFMKKLSRDIVDFDVNYNDYENRNEIFMKQLTTSSKDNVTTLPLNSISDGTLKWISSTVVAMLTDRPIVIEEPENFLHPEMQERLINLIREEVETNGQIGILTTHSESILNSLNPSEVILVHLCNRITRANRVVQPEKLQKHMNQTGFSLGWIYQTGTLDDYCY